MLRGKSKFIDFLLILIIKYFYVFITVTQLSGVWYPGSNGYGINFDIKKEILASVIFFILSILLVNIKNINLFIKSFLYILYVLYYIPINSAYSIHSTDISFLILSTIFVLLIMFFLDFKMTVTKKEIGENEKSENILDNKTVYIFCFVVCTCYIIYKFLYNGFFFSLSIDGDSVYDIRDDFVESLAGIEGTPIAYILQFVRNLADSIVPLFLYIGLSRRKKFAVIYSLFTLLCMFSVASGKGHLFFIIITIGVYILERLNLLKSFPRVFLIGMISLCMLSFVEILFLEDSWIYTVILRREMFLPGWLNTMYFEYFMSHPKYWWSESAFLLQKFIPSPYSVTPLEIISNTYFAGRMPSPNTGLLAEAVMQAGVLGVFIYPILYRFFVKYAAKTYTRLGDGVSVLFAAKIVISMTNVPVARTDFVLTLILLTVLVSFLPRIAIKFR